MRSVGAVLLVCCTLFSGSVWSAETVQVNRVEEKEALYPSVQIEYAKGDLLSEEIRWHVFVSRYGDPGLASPAVRDYYEDIVPTPGEPPVSSAWQPGDRVNFVRHATDGTHNYTRETTYERQANGSWGMAQNVVMRKLCVGPCNNLPQ